MAKKARYDNLTTVLDMGKSDFRDMRLQPFFDMPRNTDDPNFQRKEQQLIMQEIYAKLALKHAVCEQKVLNLDALNSKPYFQEAVWIVRKLGLEKLISTQQDYDIQLIHQFFATVVFDNDGIGRAHV